MLALNDAPRALAGHFYCPVETMFRRLSLGQYRLVALVARSLLRKQKRAIAGTYEYRVRRRSHTLDLSHRVFCRRRPGQKAKWPQEANSLMIAALLRIGLSRGGTSIRNRRKIMHRFMLVPIAGATLVPVLCQARPVAPPMQPRSARSSIGRGMHGTGTTWMPSSRT